MKNKAAVHMGNLSAAKRKSKLGVKGFRAYMKKIRNKPRKGKVVSLSTTNA